MIERKRCAALVELAQSAGLPEMAQRWVEQGTSLPAARSWVQARLGAPVRDLVPLTAKEKDAYSLERAILQLAGEEPPGLETDVSDALRGVLKDEVRLRGGLLLPSKLLARALSTNTPTAGAETVFPEYAGFLDMLRTRALVLSLGAQTREDLVGNPTFVKQTGDPTATWVAENPGSDVVSSQPSFTVVQLTPKTLMANVQYTRQELRQAVEEMQPLVERSLIARHARAIDLAALHGTGAGNEPAGITATTGVNAVPMGGAISFPGVVALETAVASDDADLGEMAYLMTPEVRGRAKTTEVFSGSNGRPIWTGSGELGEVNGYRAAVSNQVAKNLGGGSNEHGIIFGVWSKLVIGDWGVIELIVDELTLKKRGIIEVTSFQMADIQFEYPEAFAFGTGLTV
ncbi:MAG: phage major capsid protein [Gemmatimonadota bacterium]